MGYKIFKGVEPPAGRKLPSRYDKLMEAIAQLEVNDPVAVKIVFDDEKDIMRACSKIYGDNKHHPAWRYTCTVAKEENAIYVMKVGERILNGNGHRKSG